MKARSNGWKIIAIVFICLFIVENLLFVWAGFAANADTKREAQCKLDCGQAEAYGYDVNTRICGCYTNGIQTEQHIVK